MVYQSLCMQDETIRKGPWLQEEDERLAMFVTRLGERRWDSLARVSGLKRSGKSCRLRWLNYLRPNLKQGPITEEEKTIILQLHALWGNKWSKIARRLPGRTDNEIKNYWRTYLRKRSQIRECENACNRKDDIEEDFWYKSRATEVEIQKHSFEDTKRKDQKIISEDDYGIKNFGAINSPFETQISDWISKIPTEESVIYGNIDSIWFQGNRELEEFSCCLWT